MLNKKIKFIIFEGTDKSGKTTAREVFQKKTNFQYNSLDRFIGSMIVFGKLFERLSKEEIKEFYDDEKKFVDLFDPILVLITCNEKTVAKRIKNSNHKKISKELLKKTNNLFEEYFKNSSVKHKITIDTSNNTPDDVAEIILGHTKMINYYKIKK